MFLNASFMLSLTLTPLMGMVVCPPTIRSTSVLSSLSPPTTGTSFGIRTMPLTMPLAPMPRCKYFWPPLIPVPPKAPSSMEDFRTITSIVLLGRFSSSSSEPAR